MRKIQLNLNKVIDADRFVKYVKSVSGTMVLRSGRYTVDPRSLLGVLALDLSHPVTLELDDDCELDEEKLNQFNGMEG